MAELTVPQEHEVPHHFDDLEQEFESSKMGMWLFLASEIMMFGALLVGGFILLYRFPGAFAEGRAHLSLGMGALNTFFLLTSGFTMALAALHGQRSDQAGVRRYLWLSLLFAASFLVVKSIEYATKFHHGTLPGPFWSAEGFTQGEVHARLHHSARTQRPLLGTRRPGVARPLPPSLSGGLSYGKETPRTHL